MSKCGTSMSAMMVHTHTHIHTHTLTTPPPPHLQGHAGRQVQSTLLSSLIVCVMPLLFPPPSLPPSLLSLCADFMGYTNTYLKFTGEKNGTIEGDFQLFDQTKPAGEVRLYFAIDVESRPPPATEELPSR